MLRGTGPGPRPRRTAGVIVVNCGAAECAVGRMGSVQNADRSTSMQIDEHADRHSK